MAYDAGNIVSGLAQGAAAYFIPGVGWVLAGVNLLNAIMAPAEQYASKNIAEMQFEDPGKWGWSAYDPRRPADYQPWQTQTLNAMDPNEDFYMNGQYDKVLDGIRKIFLKYEPVTKLFTGMAKPVVEAGGVSNFGQMAMTDLLGEDFMNEHAGLGMMMGGGKGGGGMGGGGKGGKGGGMGGGGKGGKGGGGMGKGGGGMMMPMGGGKGGGMGGGGGMMMGGGKGGKGGMA